MLPWTMYDKHANYLEITQRKQFLQRKVYIPPKASTSRLDSYHPQTTKRPHDRFGRKDSFFKPIKRVCSTDEHAYFN